MQRFAAFFLPFAIFVIACRPAAAPVSISNRPASVNDVRVKKPLAEMTWTDASGKQTTLNDLEGEAVVLDFWATYCDPCRDEIPHLNELHTKYADSGLRVFGLNSGGPEDTAKIPGFLQQTPIKYETGFPDADLLSSVFQGDDRIPQTLVINRKGQVVTKIVGFNEQIKRQLDAAVSVALTSNQ
jgi:thiol-disulfide isomerase/thioredoxin